MNALEWTVPYHQSSAKNPNQPEDLLVHIAVGPFTTAETLTYAPLDDLLKTLFMDSSSHLDPTKSDKPFILILMGPFLDENNCIIESANILKSPEDIFTQDILHSHLLSALNSAKKDRLSLCKGIYLVPSLSDIHHDSLVLPQALFDLASIPGHSQSSVDSIPSSASSASVANLIRTVSNP